MMNINKKFKSLNQKKIGKKVPRIVKIIFCEYLAKILGTELSTSLKRREERVNKHPNNNIIIKTNSVVDSQRKKYQTAVLKHQTSNEDYNKQASHSYCSVPVIASNGQQVSYLKRFSNPATGSFSRKASTQSVNSPLRPYAQENTSEKNFSLQLINNSNPSVISQTDLIRNEEQYIEFIDRDELNDNFVNNKNSMKRNRSRQFDPTMLKQNLIKCNNPRSNYIPNGK